MHSDPPWKAYTALVCVCIFWGTTYLGIRMALEAFPPNLLVAARFLLSGSLLLGIAVARGAHLPRGRELWVTAALGVLILGMGNGTLAYAELLIPSGLASLFITISPFWMVGLEAAIPGGVALHAPTVLGMFVGFAGTAMLVLPGVQGAGNANTLIGFAITQFGVVSWTLGSIIQRRQTMRAHPIVTGAVQQLAVGLAFLPLALFVPAHPVHWSFRSVAALVYLAVFGSIVGYSAYIYALNKLPIAIFSVYPYVNAVVAITLGWLVYREHFGMQEALAMAVIFTGVGIVKWQTAKRARLENKGQEQSIEQDEVPVEAPSHEPAGGSGRR